MDTTFAQPSSSATETAASADTVTIDPKRRFKLLETCRSLVLDRLTEVVTGALERMVDELTAKAMKSIHGDEQRALLDAVMLVREQRDVLERQFRRDFANVFERRLFASSREPVEGLAAKADLTSDEMMLVPEESIADKIDVDRLIERARSRLDPNEVLGIRARLGALLEREWFDESNHPASPEAIYEALRATLNEIAPSADVRHALLAAFEPHVTRNLNAIYSSVNSQLVAQQVLPKIRPRLAGRSGHGATSLVRPGEAGYTAVPSGSAGAGMAAGGGAGMAGHGHVGSGGGVPVSQAVFASLQQAVMQAAVGSPRGRGDAARILSDPLMFGMADLPLEPVSDPLLHSLTEMQRDVGGDPRYGARPVSSGDMGQGTVGELSAGEIGAGELSADSGATLVRELLPLLVEKVKESGTPLDQMTVELVSVVFDYIYADKALAEPVKHQLLRLQVIAVKAALLDRSFFARRQHPMRLLIDRISQLAADPDADLAPGAPLVVGLTDVIDKLVAEFSTDLGSFLVAIDRIDELAQQESTRRAEQLASQLKAAAEEEAYSIALDQARSEISARVDQETPDFVREFLLRWWTPVIARSTVDEPAAGDGTKVAGVDMPGQDENDSPGRKALRIAEFLIWSVAPKHPEEIPRLAALVPKLIRAINDGARVVAVPGEERSRFMQELLEAHAKVIGAAKAWQSGQPDPRASAVRLRADGSVRFSKDRRGRGDDDEAQTVFVGAAALAHFEKGDRIEIIGDTGYSSVYKLAWVSPARKLYILSRYPQETLTFSATDLAALVLCNKARLVDGAAAVDLAIGELTREDGFTAQTH